MKTADEIKRGLEYLRTTDVAEKVERFKMGLPYAFTEEVADDAIALIQKLEAQVHRWISVEERLPDVDVDVVLIIPRIDGPCIRVGWLRETGRWWAAGQGLVPYEVTHWMPLPEPPEA